LHMLTQECTDASNPPALVRASSRRSTCAASGCVPLGLWAKQGTGCPCRAHLGHVQAAGLGRACDGEAGQQLSGGGRRVLIARRGQAGGAAGERQHLLQRDCVVVSYVNEL
jgi:hypothetical protein